MIPRVLFAALAVALACALPPARAQSPAPEVRGTWLTTTANDAIATPARTADTMRRLRGVGLNTVYVECWKDGYTEFPSAVMGRAVGVPMRVNPSAKGVPAVQRDLLRETLIEAHRNRLFYVAWFEYGFMAAYRTTANDLRTKHPEWMVRNADGGLVARNGFVWMNPLRPECQDLLVGIVVEAVKNYDLDGIQLDDRIVWPSLEMGYDPFTTALYAREHDGRNPPADVSDKEWCAWRAKKVTEFAKRFVREVKAANPNLVVSLSPGPYPWALDNYLCDWVNWAKWTDNPTWDEYVPQVYRADYAAFARDWRGQLEYVPARAKDLVAGVRLVGDGPDLPPGDATRCAGLVRQTGGGGHAWWFSRGVLGPFEKELAALRSRPS